MIFKDDWEMSKERFDAYWEGEILDRCCIAVTAPRKAPIDSKIELQTARDLAWKWTDSEFRVNEMISNAAKTFYGGEAFPNFFINLGPGVMAAFVGSMYKLAESTVWFDSDPIIKDWDNKPEIKYRLDTEMWKIFQNIMDKALEKAEGRYMVGVTDMGGNLDIAASFRGTETLLYDLIDYPEEVKALVYEIDSIWIKYYEKIQSLVNRHMEGSSNWMGLWCRQNWYPLQCDFSAMISPSQFAEFVKPSLAREAEFLNKSIYHWDGPGELPHLDHLLDIDNLTGIQWTPGAGNQPVCDEMWYHLYKKIQQKGKNLVLLGARPENIEKLLDNLSPKGLYISTSCSSEDEARELISKTGKWTCRNK